MSIYKQEPIKVGYHPTKFGSHEHSDSGDIVDFFCHANSQDDLI